MKVLVTGDTGFIGSNMKEFLLRMDIEVVGYSRRNGVDVRNIGQLRKVAKSCDVIYHFAAEAKPGESVFNPVRAIKVNLEGSLSVLEVCRKLDIPVVYPSSCEIYGDSNEPITEEFPLNPPNPYAASKTAIDRICYTYYACYNVDVKIVRLFNPYGPHQQLNKIMPTFYFQAIRDKPITIYGDGTDTRDYVYVNDIIRGLWLARELPAGETINLATAKATTNLEIAKLIKKLSGSNSRIVFVSYPKAFGGIKHQIGSYDKARKMLGWKPKFSLEEGIRRTINWLKATMKGDSHGRK